MVRNVSAVTIAAPASKVWTALTQREFVKLWQFGSELITDWNVGSSIRFKTVWEQQVFEQWGTVLEFSPASMLRYTLFAPRPGLADIPENYFEMNYILAENGGSTDLIIAQIDNRENAVQEDPQDVASNPMLASLKNIVENVVL